jgi:DNA-3-methyladenine glycosylase I
MTATYKSVDGLHRCSWCAATEQYQHYHDEEWGYPVVDDRRLFEKLCLESFQSGLSWRTILEKRDHFRQAFKQFDFRLMAQFNEDDVNRLLNDAGIVRHRGKIEAVINNARCAIKLCKESGSLAHFFWQFAPDNPNQIHPEPIATSPESTALAKALKKRGWKFVGPTTVYSFMQAMGMVNDHHPDCVFRSKVEQAQSETPRPSFSSK